MHNLSKLQKKMEFLDVFKEYRQVSKEAFEVRLQLLIFPLFLNHSFWPKCSWGKKNNTTQQNKNVHKKSTAAGTKLKTVMVVMISQCPKQGNSLSRWTQIFIY